MAAPPPSDWFHCNRCYRQEGAGFCLTSCGHLLCQRCLGAGPCPICATACRRFPLPEQPHEAPFLRSPAAVARQRLAHISQAWRFQRAQAELLLGSQRQAARRAQAALREARQALEAKEREAEALRKENGELRRHLREAEVPQIRPFYPIFPHLTPPNSHLISTFPILSFFPFLSPVFPILPPFSPFYHHFSPFIPLFPLLTSLFPPFNPLFPLFNSLFPHFTPLSPNFPQFRPLFPISPILRYFPSSFPLFTPFNAPISLYFT
uniref:RING-type domain-containing protein n=1 Tax=Cairina moschata TaxID=8855 RepID=A0A8C3BGW7_CAIMO